MPMPYRIVCSLPALILLTKPSPEESLVLDNSPAREFTEHSRVMESNLHAIYEDLLACFMAMNKILGLVCDKAFP